jgi:curli biogenesis system outer membrane secretion channel CsgG
VDWREIVMHVRTSIRPIAALGVSVACLLLAAPGQSQKPRIAVLGFENNTTFTFLGDRLGLAASDEMTTQLVRTGEFSVIERRQIDAILAEQKAGMSGVVDPATAARIGKVLGAQMVIVGSITKFSMDTKSGGIGPLSAKFTEAESTIDARAINTTTGEIMIVADGSGKKRFGGAGYKEINFEKNFDAGIAQEALRPAVEETVKKLLSDKSRFAALAAAAPSGAVVGARGTDFYIDRGANLGVEVGQRFDVMRAVQEITDASGNVLDVVTEKVGVLEITRVLTQSSIAKLVEGQAKEGDKVRPAG